jgi:hypothetical protein
VREEWTWEEQQSVDTDRAKFWKGLSGEPEMSPGSKDFSRRWIRNQLRELL